jgi:hypothetical protein
MSRSPEELDKLILARTQPQWRKVAYIIAAVGQSMNERTDENYDALAARIAALVKAGRLEAQGDLKEWRSSEVRLPQN